MSGTSYISRTSMDKIERLAIGVAKQLDHSAPLPVLRLDDPGEPLNGRLDPIDEQPTGGDEAYAAPKAEKRVVESAVAPLNPPDNPSFEKIHARRDDRHVPSVPRQISISRYQP